MANNYTLLTIDGIELSDDASLGIRCSVRPEANGNLDRDWNGNIVDETIENFRKLQVSVSCDWIDAPVLTGVWKGSGPHTVTLIPHVGLVNNTDNTMTLSMYVDDWTVTRDEFDAVTGWQLDLREA